MQKYKIEFSSITYILKAKNLLANNGITAFISKNNNLSKIGCGYILTVNYDIDKILMLFDINRIKYISYELIWWFILITVLQLIQNPNQS